MSIEKLRSGRYRVRYHVAGRGSPKHSATFDRKRDAELFEASMRRRKAFGDLGLLDAGTQPVSDLAREWWERYAVPSLANHTLDAYARVLDAHVVPRLGNRCVRDLSPNVVRDFRAKLERSGVGRDSVRKSLVVLQAMFRYAEGSAEWSVSRNPVKSAEKSSGKRQRAVVCLAPSQVEAIRTELGPSQPGRSTSSRLFAKSSTSGGWPPDAPAIGRSSSLAVTAIPGGDTTGTTGAGGCGTAPAKARRSSPFRPMTSDVHSLRCTSGAGTSVPELAQMLGHSAQMTLSTYTHVIRELRGQPAMSVENRILAPRCPPVAHGRGAGGV